MIRINKPLLKQLMFFGAVGLTTLAIDLTVTTTLYNVAHFHAYQASGIGFLSGFFFNFPLNRKKVFRHNEHDRFVFKMQIVLYTTLSFFNLLATSLLTQLIVSAKWTQIAYAKIMVTALVAGWNFIIFKTIIFSKKERGSSKVLDERTLGDIF